MADTKVKFGVAFPAIAPLGQIKAAVLMLRALRSFSDVESVFVWDHHQHLYPDWLYQKYVTKPAANAHAFLDWCSALVQLKPWAGSLQLGVAATDVVRDLPHEVAKRINTVAWSSKKPPILVLGSGEAMSIKPFGYNWEKPVTRLAHALPIIQHYIHAPAGQPWISHQDDPFFSYDQDAVMGLRAPSGKEPKIWIGGHMPRTRDLVCHADGWYPLSLVGPDEYAEWWAKIVLQAQALGRSDVDDMTPALQPYIVIVNSQGELDQLFKHNLFRYMALLAPDTVWSNSGLNHPLGQGHRGYIDMRPELHTREEIEAAMEKADPELAKHGLIIGTFDQVVDRLLEYHAAGVRYIVPQLPTMLLSQSQAMLGLWHIVSLSRAMNRKLAA